MNFNEVSWIFDLSPMNWVIAGSFLFISSYFSFRTYSKSGWKKFVGLWETLRLMLVCLLCLTLFDPQRFEVTETSGKAEILVLVDESESMETKDLEVSGERIETRNQWARSFIEKTPLKTLEKNATVHFRFFSSGAGKKRTDLHQPIQEALNEFSNLRAVLTITDGDGNMGPAVDQTAAQLVNAGIRSFTIFTGSEYELPDLAIEHTTAPSFTLNEERLVVGWLIKNSFQEPKRTTLRLHAANEVVASMPIFMKESQLVSGNISWLPPREGDYEMKLSIQTVDGESFTDNNARSFSHKVKPKLIKVLLIDSYPRWEYRFLRNALLRDPGIELQSILFHPELPDHGKDLGSNSLALEDKNLASYDVFFIGDVGLAGNEMEIETCRTLNDLVEKHASGIVFMPGRRGRQLSLSDTPLSEVLPVVYDAENPLGLGTSNPAKIELTERGQSHWLTHLRGAEPEEPDRKFWNRLPGFHWSAMVQKSRPGAVVLATHSNFSSQWGKMPLIATRPHGAGKALFVGTDSIWRWRKGVEDKYHYRFWSQVVRWMAHGRHQSHQDGIRLISDPENPSAGDRVFLRCIVLDENGFPLENGNLSGQAIHPSGALENLAFSSDPECPGVFLSSVVTGITGRLTLDLTESSTSRKLKTQLFVSENVGEKKGRSIVKGPLSTLARLSKGKVASHQEWKKILPSLKTTILPEKTTHVFRLRASFEWGFLLFSLLVIYWTGRKFLGMV